MKKYSPMSDTKFASFNCTQLIFYLLRSCQPIRNNFFSLEFSNLFNSRLNTEFNVFWLCLNQIVLSHDMVSNIRLLQSYTVGRSYVVVDY